MVQHQAKTLFEHLEQLVLLLLFLLQQIFIRQCLIIIILFNLNYSLVNLSNTS